MTTWLILIKIDYGNVLTVLPFGGTFDLLVINGSTLYDTFNHAVSTYESASSPGQFLQVSGFNVEYNIANPVGYRVVSLKAKNINGIYETVQLNEQYSVGTTDFCADGGMTH